jgi:hypothetical protein
LYLLLAHYTFEFRTSATAARQHAAVFSAIAHRLLLH